VASDAPVYTFGSQFTITSLSEGAHTLRITATSGSIGIDGFILPGTGTTPVVDVTPTATLTETTTVPPVTEVGTTPTAELPTSTAPVVDAPTPTSTAPVVDAPTPTPTPIPLALPATATMDDGAPGWQATAGWSLTAEAAYSGTGLGWKLQTGNTPDVLRWSQSIDLRNVFMPQQVKLSFLSRLATLSGTARLDISLDGGTQWMTVTNIAPTADWTLTEIDLTAFAGNVVQLQFAWQPDATFAEGSTPAALWSLDNVTVQAAVPVTPTPTWTVEAPTSTPTFTWTPEPPTATPTNTPEPPTATPTFTWTPEPPTATPTNTPEPPTAEPPTATPAA
jgi:hypothetical protein